MAGEGGELDWPYCLSLSSLQWTKWNPPSWVGECVQSAVTGHCAVPPQIISKDNMLVN